MNSLRRGRVTLLGLCLLLALVISGCSSGGGGGDNENQPPPDTQPRPDTVNVQGAVHTGGTPPLPVADAACQFVDTNGVVQAQTRANGNGEFLLALLPGIQGTILCTPANLAQLTLVAFASTLGAAAGDILPPTGREIISPQSTLITTRLAQERPVNPEARKAELLAQLADPNSDLAIIGRAAAVLYEELLAAEANVDFANGTNGDTGESGEEGGDGGGGGGGGGDAGVSGGVGDGAEFSPIPQARCEAVLELDDDTVLFTALLHDLLSDAEVNRPDMQAVAAVVNQALGDSANAITAAYARLFPNGIGLALRTTATDEGRYFLPVPAHVPVYVTCHPPERENLVLATFVRGREEDERLDNEDVNPALTIFSTQIVAKLREMPSSTVEEIVTAKENFLADIQGLRVNVEQDATGNITGFAAEGPTPDSDEEANVRLLAFTATALYTTLLTKEIDANYRNVVQNVVENFAEEQPVDPVDIIEEIPELPPEQVQELADVVNTSTEEAEQVLNTNRDVALSTARIRARVREARGGDELQGATVTVISADGNIQCTNCPQTTDANGEATLRLAQIQANQTVQVTLEASLEGFVSDRVRRRVVALANVTADFQLEEVTGSGGGGGTQ